MTERRYNDEEVDEIFARASETEQDSRRQLTPASEGMTLAQLQQIGREAGLAPDVVAQAARALDQPRQPEIPQFLGLQIGAARTVKLERRMTDEEWERLVVELRETFQARGVIRSEGSFRQWSNGNLQVLLEPDGDTHRVRFKTIRGQARPFMTFGIGLIALAVVTFAARMVSGAGNPTDTLEQSIMLGIFGGGMFAAGALPLRNWARLRKQQMDDLAGRLLASIGARHSPPQG
jgi:hypothetical protein